MRSSASVAAVSTVHQVCPFYPRREKQLRLEASLQGRAPERDDKQGRAALANRKLAVTQYCFTALYF